MWTTEFIYNLSDASSAHLLLAAGSHETAVRVSYLGGRAGGPPVAEFDDNPPVPVPAESASHFTIDLAHPAFAGGFGAIRARSVSPTGGTSAAPFLAFSVVNAPADSNLVSGPQFVGPHFRLPLMASASGQRVRLTITVIGMSKGTAPVRIRQSNPSGFDTTKDVEAMHTLYWDSATQRNRLKEAQQLVVSCPAGVVVSAFVQRPNASWHVHLPASDD